MFSAPALPHMVFGHIKRLFALVAVGACLAACTGGETETEAEEPIDFSIPREAAGTDFIEGVIKSETGWQVGAKDAPVTVVEFGSFTCGGCAGFHAQIEPKLVEEFVKTGYVLFEFRSFTRNEPDILATMVAECLGPTKFKGVKNLYFSSLQKWLSSSNPNDYVAEMARRAGVSSASFQRCVKNDELRTQIASQTQQAQTEFRDEDGYFRTPTVVVDGKKLNTGSSWDAISNAIERALRS
ncbi:MAG: thioredoxin domain-containing protein [Pseudomonadota bacterium]